MGTLKDILKKIVFIGYNLSSHFIPVKNNVIMFESSNSRNYTGNPRYIYEEMVRQGLDNKYKCVWSLTDTSINIPGNCLKIKRPGIKFLFYSFNCNRNISKISFLCRVICNIFYRRKPYII